MTTNTPTPPAPADDASGAEAMRADFLAWVNAGYLVRDAVTPVEWDDEGLPVYYTRDDGVRHYLDGEWHAWQAARALIYARDDAPTPPAPADGFMRGQEYMRRRCADVLGGRDAELIRKLPLHGDSQERCGAARVGAVGTGAEGRGGAGEGPPPSASPVEGDRRDLVPVNAPADGIQHDMETRCPKCGKDYRLHKGDEVECVCPTPPAPDDAPPKRGVYAVRYDDRTGRYAVAITRGGWDVLHLHVGSMRNTAENVRAVVDAMNAANPAADAVEEAARALLRRLDGFVYGDSPHYDLPETDALHEALLAAERAAALRREKGGA